MHSLVLEMPGRCVSRAVACCYRTGWVVIVPGMQLFLWLLIAYTRVGQGECTCMVSVVPLVLVGVVMLMHAFVGVRNARLLWFASSGVLLSYRLGCDCAWYAAMFVVVYRPGRLHQHGQRGAIGLG